MQSDFESKFLNLSQQLQEEKDMRILLSRELFELSFLKVETELEEMSEVSEKLKNLETKFELQKTSENEVLNAKIQSSIVVGADCNRIGKYLYCKLSARWRYSIFVLNSSCLKQTHLNIYTAQRKL